MILLAFHEQFFFQNEFGLPSMDLNEPGSYLPQLQHIFRPLLLIQETTLQVFAFNIYYN